VLPTFTEPVAEATVSRIEAARRRIRDGYYDRPEVRRILASRLIHRLARNRPQPPNPEREAPESP